MSSNVLSARNSMLASVLRGGTEVHEHEARHDKLSKAINDQVRQQVGVAMADVQQNIRKEVDMLRWELLDAMKAKGDTDRIRPKHANTSWAPQVSQALDRSDPRTEQELSNLVERMSIEMDTIKNKIERLTGQVEGNTSLVTKVSQGTDRSGQKIEQESSNPVERMNAEMETIKSEIEGLKGVVVAMDEKMQGSIGSIRDNSETVERLSRLSLARGSWMQKFMKFNGDKVYEFDCRSGAGLGLEFVAVPSKGLKIVKILPWALVGEWNASDAVASHPEQAIQEGNVITQINDVRADVRQLKDAMERKDILKVTIEKSLVKEEKEEEVPRRWSLKQPWW